MAAFIQVCAKCKTKQAALSTTYQGRPAALCLDCYGEVIGMNQEKRVELNRKHQREKYQNEPEFREKHSEYTRIYQKERYHNDPEYREKKRNYIQEWRQQQKKAEAVN